MIRIGIDHSQTQIRQPLDVLLAMEELCSMTQESIDSPFFKKIISPPNIELPQEKMSNGWSLSSTKTWKIPVHFRKKTDSLHILAFVCLKFIHRTAAMVSSN